MRLGLSLSVPLRPRPALPLVPFRPRPPLALRTRTISTTPFTRMPNFYHDQLPTPKTQLAPEETVQVRSKSSSRTYTCKRVGEHYSCSCPAWKMQKGASVDARTCKHLRELLGDAYENRRLNLNTSDPTSNATAATTSGKKRTTPSSKSTSATLSKKPKKSEPSLSVSPEPDVEVEDPSGTPPKKSIQLLLANKFDINGKKDPTGWWISEKLDGVRAYWDGQNTLWSRLGNPFFTPDWFLSQLPKGHTLDGELFHTRSNFSTTSSIVRSHASQRWNEIDYQVFDIPSLSHLPFESRLSALESLFKNSEIVDPVTGKEAKKGEEKEKEGRESGKVVKLVKQTPCKSLDHLIEMLKEVEKSGGEGLMLREPSSLYVGKRSNTLLKVKTFHDAEAKVIGYEPGKGKYLGKVGSLLCEMESGKQFNVGSGLNDEQRASPPSIGAIISYRFGEITTDGVPRFPTFVGERGDVKGAKDADVSREAEKELEGKAAGKSVKGKKEKKKALIG